MEIQPQNPEFRNNPTAFTQAVSGLLWVHCEDQKQCVSLSNGF